MVVVLDVVDVLDVVVLVVLVVGDRVVDVLVGAEDDVVAGLVVEAELVVAVVAADEGGLGSACDGTTSDRHADPTNASRISNGIRVDLGSTSASVAVDRPVLVSPARPSNRWPARRLIVRRPGYLRRNPTREDSP